MAIYTYSRQITRQLEANTKSAKSALELAEPIAAVIEQKLAPIVAETEPKVDWKQIQTLFGRLLSHSGERLRQVDESHAQTEVDGKFLLRQRNQAVAQLRVELRRTRFLLDQSLSKEDAKALFPQRGQIGKLGATDLVALGRHLVNLLRAEELASRARAGSPALNPEGTVQAVEEATRQLEVALDLLGSKQQRQSFSLDQRRQERKEAMRTYRSTRELLRGFYRLAGYDYLAEQLQDRRRPQLAEETETEGASSPPLTSPTLTASNAGTAGTAKGAEVSLS